MPLMFYIIRAYTPQFIDTVGKNIIGAPKIQKKYALPISILEK